MRCEKCGRKGLFFKVNERGLCKDCEALVAIQESKQAQLDMLRQEKQ